MNHDDLTNQISIIKDITQTNGKHSSMREKSP